MPLLLICGIPGAGKTTIAKQLSTHFKAKYFSFDEFVQSQLLKPTTSSSLNYFAADSPSYDFDSAFDEDLLKPMKAYRKLWQNLIETYLNKMLEVNVFKNPLIIIDDNFYLQSQRRDFAKIGKRYGLQICCIKMVVDMSEAQRRNNERNGIKDERILEILRVDSEMIRKMDKRFEDSGIDYFYNSIKNDINDLITFIQAFLIQSPDNFSSAKSSVIPPPPMEQSIFQELDSISRKVANKIISSGYQRYGSAINKIRREFMEQTKDDKLNVKLNLDTVDFKENEILIEKFLFDKIKECGIGK